MLQLQPMEGFDSKRFSTPHLQKPMTEAVFGSPGECNARSPEWSCCGTSLNHGSLVANVPSAMWFRDGAVAQRASLIGGNAFQS